MTSVTPFSFADRLLFFRLWHRPDRPVPLSLMHTLGPLDTRFGSVGDVLLGVARVDLSAIRLPRFHSTKSVKMAAAAAAAAGAADGGATWQGGLSELNGWYHVRDEQHQFVGQLKVHVRPG